MTFLITLNIKNNSIEKHSTEPDNWKLGLPTAYLCMQGNKSDYTSICEIVLLIVLDN